MTGINYNFDLTGKVIEGIEVRILHATWNGNSGYYANLSVELQWDGRTSTTNSLKTDLVNDQFSGWNNNFKNVTLGSPTDLWGRTSWDPSDFSNANFGVKIEAIDLFPGISESVDVAWVKVYYSDAPVVVIDPWIEIQDLPSTIDFKLGTELVVALNSTVKDPSELGYNPVNATLLVNNTQVLTLSDWSNDELVYFNVTPYLQTEAIYNVVIQFKATNGTHWLSEEVSFTVKVISIPVTSESSDNSATSTVTVTDESSVSAESSSSTIDDPTESESDGVPELPINFGYFVFGFIGLTYLRRRK